MADQFLHTLTDTWNGGSTTFYAIRMNVTDTASAADSKLLELQIDGVTQFSVSKTGVVTTAGGALVAASRSFTAGNGLLGGGDLSADRTISADIAADANIHAGTANKLIAAGEIYTANAPVATSGTGTYTPDLNAGRVFQRTLTGNSTLANPTNQVPGQSGVIYIIQDATGGRTLSLGTDWKPIGGTPSIDTGANKVNVFSYYVRAANNISLTYLGAE